MNSEFEIKHHEDFGNHHESSRTSIWTHHESWCRITKIDENITNQKVWYALFPLFKKTETILSTDKFTITVIC